MAEDVVAGILFGCTWGCLTNLLLFRKMANNRAAGVETLRGIGFVFFVRYLLDAAALVLFYVIVRSGYALTAAALSLTVAVKASLFHVYARKGGKLE
ncbi:MAG: hypothetical protein DIU55_002375 [Bacillota bacterium]|nr:MAG: hypothetical protein DIU55_10270 [Bacillota bacterium]